MGMVGVDLHMEDIVQDITYYNNNDQSYAFLITTHGERSLSAVEPPPLPRLTYRIRQKGSWMIEGSFTGEIGKKGFQKSLEIGVVFDQGGLLSGCFNFSY